MRERTKFNNFRAKDESERHVIRSFQPTRETPNTPTMSGSVL
jgi:hypothetical protein